MALKELWNRAGEWKKSNSDVEKKECLDFYSRGRGRSDPVLHFFLIIRTETLTHKKVKDAI